MLGGAARTLRIAALLGVVVVAGACGGDDGDEGSADTTAATTTSATTTTLDPKAEVEAAYLAYWDAYLKAVSEPVNPELPELQQVVTGVQKTIVTRNLQQLQARGEAVRLNDPSRYRHVVQTIDGTNGDASVEACVYDDLITYNVGSGAVVDNSVAWKKVHAQLVREQDMWLISFLEIGQANGGGSCASA
jgi:hypothetical protein